MRLSMADNSGEVVISLGVSGADTFDASLQDEVQATKNTNKTPMKQVFHIGLGDHYSVKFFSKNACASFMPPSEALRMRSLA